MRMNIMMPVSKVYIFYIVLEYYDDNEYDEDEYMQQYHDAIGQGLYMYIYIVFVRFILWCVCRI